MKRFIGLYVALFLTLASVCQAAVQEGLGITPVFSSPSAGLTFNEVLSAVAGTLIKNALVYVGVATLAMLVWAGFKWMTAAGDSHKIDEAKDIIKWTAIGLGVIFGSYVVLNALFGVINALLHPGTFPPIK